MAAVDLRLIEEGERRPFLSTMSRAFGGDPVDDAIFRAFAPSLKHGRLLAAYDEAEIVGTFVVYPMSMVVPECRSVPTAVVSGVAVLPTHRRQGILTRMMDRQLRRAYEEGETVAILEASESVIYGRFGFGIATHYERWGIDRHHANLALCPDVAGRVRFIEKNEALSRFPAIAALACADRPGFVAVHQEQWVERIEEYEFYRAGAGRLNFAVYEEMDETCGYVVYRIRDRTVEVIDLIAATEAAYAGLWRFVFGIDLRTRTEAHNRPVDDMLPWMLADRRRLERTLSDSMWLRILDIPGALEARDYAVDGRVVFEVRDEFCPWNEGRYELETADGGVRCKRTKAQPDITLPVSSLACMYLGDTRLSVLVRGLRAEAHSPEAIELADLMFRSRQKPWWPHPL